MTKKYNILIVEDVPIQAKKLQYVLQKLEYNVTWKQDGKLAYEELKQNDDYQLIISDYQMPNWDGLQFLNALKKDEEINKIPFILLTTIDDENVFLQSLNLGANEFLNKPFRPEELKIRCKNIILLYEYQSLIEAENKNLLHELTDKNKILEEKLTEIAESHQQLKDMQTELIQASKMASLGTMGAGMAHEINNPLTIIKSYNNKLKKIMSKEELDTDRLAKINGSINTAVDRIMNIVKHLKAFARGEGSDKEDLAAINPNQMLTELHDFYGGLVAENQIKVEQNLFEGTYEVFGSRTIYEQIFLNLINNAIDAMESSTEKVLLINTEIIEDKKISVTIGDTGSGIPQEVMEKLYDPFFTTKDPNKGTGLGMSLVKSYIKECNGTIDCKSVKGDTKFTVTFDIYQEDKKEENIKEVVS